MSFVAKVFVVFNLIMSAFFLMFATYIWTANTKWQRMYEQEKTRKVGEILAEQKNEKDLAAQKILAEKGEKLHDGTARQREARQRRSDGKRNLKICRNHQGQQRPRPWPT